MKKLFLIGLVFSAGLLLASDSSKEVQFSLVHESLAECFSDGSIALFGYGDSLLGISAVGITKTNDQLCSINERLGVGVITGAENCIMYPPLRLFREHVSNNTNASAADNLIQQVRDLIRIDSAGTEIFLKKFFKDTFEKNKNNPDLVNKGKDIFPLGNFVTIEKRGAHAGGGASAQSWNQAAGVAGGVASAGSQVLQQQDTCCCVVQ